MVGNPLLDSPNLEALAELANSRNIPLIIDNTVPTAYLCKPFDFGAHVVIYSATKYIGGHGTTIGGVVIENGNYDWGNGRFPQFTGPDAIYNGIALSEQI